MKKNPVLIWLITGVLFVVIGVYMAFLVQIGCVKTSAVITDIHDYGRRKGGHKAYVSYTVNDVEYTNVALDTWVASYRVGKEITVYYDPDDPTKVKVRSFALGGTFIVFGLMSITVPILKLKQRR